jgi:hypothetical protein
VLADVCSLIVATPGSECVLDKGGKRAAGLDHPRAGEFVAISAADKWFSGDLGSSGRVSDAPNKATL